MISQLRNPFAHSKQHVRNETFWHNLHIDFPLLVFISLLIGFGLFILYSAGNESLSLLQRQISRFGIAFIAMFITAQVSPPKLRHWAPWLYCIGILLLLIVLGIGHIGKGAQRWLSLGFFNFQPSEFLKLLVPMTVSWYMSKADLPPSNKQLLLAALIIIIPTVLIVKQPDLGTALVIAASGGIVVFLAGMRRSIIVGLFALAGILAPVFWHLLHNYQKQRILTFLNPERDPLGSGYHIIQSKIAIGSGGLFGKGWLAGTQAHLQFLPEHTTDFIFAVCGEEFGLIGSCLLISVYLLIVWRCFYIALNAQDQFSRLLAGSLLTLFFLSVFINIGMVIGILPVVGLPLPLVSYGGTSMVTVLMGFGILMSIHTHRKLLRF